MPRIPSARHDVTPLSTGLFGFIIFTPFTVFALLLMQMVCQIGILNFFSDLCKSLGLGSRGG
jgi:hypothetical protein